jgi:phosphate/sulfate permease
MHDSAERFDPRTEQVFKILQVISACAMSFAHGSNDIANSIGSFSAAYYVYQNMAVPGSNAEVRHGCQKWKICHSVAGAYRTVYYRHDVALAQRLSASAEQPHQ